ncbi:MAG TPA: HAMP domain-containing protein [Tepidiformaceae bacterium]|nr:HAMP domain-containing protein [Tepidiformaceae bacterium]
MRGTQFGNLGMDRVSIRTKLWVVVAVLAIPILVLMWVQFGALQSSSNRASEERAGVEFETAGLKLVHDLQLHRDHEMRVLRGNTGTQASLDKSTADIDADFETLRPMAREAGVGKELVTLQQEWQQFKGQQRTSAVDSFGAHTDFINKRAMQVLLTGATRSHLFTDDELATRSVIQALLASLNMSEQIAQGRSIGNLMMVDGAGREPSQSERATMAKYLTASDVYANELRFQMNLAISAKPELADQLQPLMSKQEQTLANFSSFVNTNFVQATVLESTRAESAYLLGTSAVEATNELLTAAATNLNAEFNDRTASATREMQVIGGVAVLGIAAALLLAFMISRSISRPISHLAEVADRISLGELDVEIDVQGTNEVGHLAESLRRMQASLRSAIERLRQRRAA